MLCEVNQKYNWSSWRIWVKVMCAQVSCDVKRHCKTCMYCILSYRLCLMSIWMINISMLYFWDFVVNFGIKDKYIFVKFSICFYFSLLLFLLGLYVTKILCITQILVCNYNTQILVYNYWKDDHTHSSLIMVWSPPGAPASP